MCDSFGFNRGISLNSTVEAKRGFLKKISGTPPCDGQDGVGWWGFFFLLEWCVGWGVGVVGFCWFLVLLVVWFVGGLSSCWVWSFCVVGFFLLLVGFVVCVCLV